MIGRTYLLRGERVTVLARWRNPTDAPPGEAVVHGRVSCTPRNVLLKLPDGRISVRPFRGLRRAA